jgi:hypothetical protein
MSVTPPPPPDESHEAARERVQLPATFLVANGALNLLVALFAAGYAVNEMVTPAEAMRDAWVARLRSLEKTGELTGPLKQALVQARDADPQRFKRQRVITDGAASAFLLLVGLLGVAGGVRMHQARAYALAVVGSLASLAPCVSPMACCGAGELVGGWCITVLLLPGVRAGFR